MPQGFEGPRPVLYMHDGQNLFRSTPFIGKGWQVAETITALAGQGLIDPPIVVGITSTANRLGDYLPQKPMSSAEALQFVNEHWKFSGFKAGQMKADDYLVYLTKVVKPFIDANYDTLSDADHTALMGSSMGGLISAYGLCEYPQIFGMAGCLSTHWPITGEFMLEYFDKHLPKPGAHRFYFDHGDKGMDAAYQPWQTRVDELLVGHGYEQDKDFQSWTFPGDDHHEEYWANRLHIPLSFFFGVNNWPVMQPV